jgi:hypothetical protein
VRVRVQDWSRLGARIEELVGRCVYVYRDGVQDWSRLGARIEELVGRCKGGRRSSANKKTLALQHKTNHYLYQSIKQGVVHPPPPLNPSLPTSSGDAYTAFLRVVRFLRRNRSLYRRTVISFLPSEARSSATLARSTTPSRRTGPRQPAAPSRSSSFSFLPNPCSRRICDAGDGHILLAADTPVGQDSIWRCRGMTDRGAALTTATLVGICMHLAPPW